MDLNEAKLPVFVDLLQQKTENVLEGLYVDPI